MTHFLSKLLPFTLELGKFALDNQSQISFKSAAFKSDATWNIVTATDLEISRRCQEFLAREFSDLDYILVEEESVANLGREPMTEIFQHEYVFIIDPLDGTLTYSAGLPYFGINIAAFKNGQPQVGIIYLPALDLLLYADEQGAYQVKHGETTPLLATDQPMPFFSSSYAVEKYLGDHYMPITFYSAAVNSAYVLTGQTSCWAFGAYIWDGAAAYVIGRHLNINLFSLANGQVIDFLKAETFKTNLQCQEVYLFCRPPQVADFQDLLQVIPPKK